MGALTFYIAYVEFRPMRPPQMTSHTFKVLSLLMARANQSGAEIGKATKLPTGTLYPLLLRLEKAGWLSSEWEVGDPTALGRPRRRFYKVTGVGAAHARAHANSLAATLEGAAAWA